MADSTPTDRAADEAFEKWWTTGSVPGFADTHTTYRHIFEAGRAAEAEEIAALLEDHQERWIGQKILLDDETRRRFKLWILSRSARHSTASQPAGAETTATIETREQFEDAIRRIAHANGPVAESFAEQLLATPPPEPPLSSVSDRTVAEIVDAMRGKSPLTDARVVELADQRIKARLGIYDDQKISLGMVRLADLDRRIDDLEEKLLRITGSLHNAIDRVETRLDSLESARGDWRSIIGAMPDAPDPRAARVVEAAKEWAQGPASRPGPLLPDEERLIDAVNALASSPCPPDNMTKTVEAFERHDAQRSQAGEGAKGCKHAAWLAFARGTMRRCFKCGRVESVESKPPAPPAEPCPCVDGPPCRSSCTCFDSLQSGGCDRCARWGSKPAAPPAEPSARVEALTADQRVSAVARRLSDFNGVEVDPGYNLAVVELVNATMAVMNAESAARRAALEEAAEIAKASANPFTVEAQLRALAAGAGEVKANG